ncbi:MAG: class I SAM-dependent rRNA methyltransferase [Parachlamydiales bacterium]
MQLKGVVLKKGKERVLLKRHPWIFSGAVLAYPEGFVNGSLSAVFSFEKELLGYGYFNRNCSLCGRMVSFGDEDPHEALRKNLKRALDLRQRLFEKTKTTAYRLVNGEGDGLPGLIVDRYGDFLVLQIGTLGMEKLKNEIVGHLTALLRPEGILEKSSSSSRKEEGLEALQACLFGRMFDEVEILENGKRFSVACQKGQKTGFFLDQREMRALVERHARGKKVLNAFGYSGAFSVYALKGGAQKADTVDLSIEALALAKKNLALNGLESSENGFFQQDVFAFLSGASSKEPGKETRPRPESGFFEYDLVILDPPAFAKKKADLSRAAGGYQELNRLALQRMPKGSFLLSSSCSYFIDEKLFSQILFAAALEAGREVRILSRHLQAPDHPRSIYHPEGDYLKSLFLYVD